MPSTPEPKHLSNHHRATLLQLFQHPTSHNIDFRDVLSLLETVGSVEQRSDGKYAVRVAAENELFLTRPAGKDIDVQQVVELRKILTNAGYRTVVDEFEAKGQEI